MTAKLDERLNELTNTCNVSTVILSRDLYHEFVDMLADIVLRDENFNSFAAQMYGRSVVVCDPRLPSDTICLGGVNGFQRTY